jgi:hypothetical protein
MDYRSLRPSRIFFAPLAVKFFSPEKAFNRKVREGWGTLKSTIFGSQIRSSPRASAL